MKNPTILAISGGFYIFGDLIPLNESPSGFIAMTKVAMFGEFGGRKGIGAVCRGDKDATVTLSKFAAHETCLWPVSSNLGIYPSVNLYEFSGTTVK